MGEGTGEPICGGVGQVRAILHELNNRLFVVRMSAASLAESIDPDGSDAEVHRIEAIASAAEEADVLLKRLEAALRAADR